MIRSGGRLTCKQRPERCASGRITSSLTFHRSVSRFVVVLFFAVAALGGKPIFAADLARVLTTAAAVHDLSQEEAGRSLPVHLIATVTYSQPDYRRLFLSDATGSVFAFAQLSKDVQPGDLVDLTGTTIASSRAAISNTTVRLIAKGHLPHPVPADFRRMQSGDLDCQYVSITGSVRSITLEPSGGSLVAELLLMVPGGLIRVGIEDYRGIDLDALVDSEVSVSGVVGGIFNGRNQLVGTILYLTDKRELTVLKRPKLGLAELPLTPIDKVLPSRYNINLSQRVRVRGSVTFYQAANSIVIQNGAESLFALTNEAKQVALGSVVDVVGFADNRGYGPMLEDAEILPTGRSEAVSPAALTYDQALSGEESDNLITLHGTVLSELHGEVYDSMVVLVEQHPVNVSLWSKHGARLPDLAVGTSVAVTGICRLTAPSAWENLLLFQLNMRESSDIKVLAQPSWWTVTHMLYILGVLLSISVIVTGWALALRQRVSMQRERIQHTMRMERERSRLLEQINSELPLENLLEDICSSIGSLISDVECSCELLDEDAMEVASPRPVTQAPETLFEAVLTGTAGHQVGVFRVKNAASRSLSKEEQETIAIGASLSNLAVNQRKLYQRLNYHSTHDQLTALPNRRLSDMHLEKVFRAAMQGGQRIGVVYIDVDKFKQVNDKHGHRTGDLYLQQIARRLSAMVRARDLLARIGGDEFLLTAELSSLEDGEAYKKRLQSCFDECFILEGVTIYGSASIGIAVYPDHGATREDLQRHADMEMYAAKQSDRIAVFAGQAPKQRVAS